MKEQQTREECGSYIKPHKREKIHSIVTNQAEYEIWNQGGDVAHIVDDRQAIYISLIYITKEKRDNIKHVTQ